jgi:putative multiple sugar transport system permease protein
MDPADAAVRLSVTMRTTIGRRIYALGGNERRRACRAVNTRWLTFGTFVNMGVLAAVAGLVFRRTPEHRDARRPAWASSSDVIAACFIGGASASGGVGKVLGAVIGAFVMGVMNNGMSILGIGIDYQQVIKGLVLLAAVFVDVYKATRLEARGAARTARRAP